MTDSRTGEPCGCPDFTVSRRSLLRSGAALGGALAVTQMFGDSLMQATFAGTTGGNTLVVLSLRGGCDGLGVVVPHGDPGYYKVRPNTAVPAASVICADPVFGLHPAMAPLQKYWQSGELAAVQATGLPVANRSHFSAIEEVEDAAPGSSLRSGWINRMIGLGSTTGSLDAVQLGTDFPTAALTGDAKSLATSTLEDLQIVGLSDRSTQRYGSLATAWTGATGTLAAGAREAVAISQGPGKLLASMPAPATAYPTEWYATPFADPLKSAAQLIKADLGTDVIAIDGGNWDLHAGYGTLAYGQMQYNVSGLAKSLAAFFDDLGTLRQRVTLVTISEFGRRVAENGSAGFDHGWGNMMLVAGAGVKGGRYYGRWPTLDAAALAEGDLKVTTDYRNVLGEIVAKRFPDRSTAQLFPGLTYSPLGLMT
jgi:uncharacterized protein (DUF1501 family)